MGMESFNQAPTKESLTFALTNAQQSLERNKRKLQEALDTPVSNLFSQGEKDMAIKNHETAIEHDNAAITSAQEKLSGLKS